MPHACKIIRRCLRNSQCVGDRGRNCADLGSWLMQINPSWPLESMQDLQSRRPGCPATEDIRHASPEGNFPSEPLSYRGPGSSYTRTQFSAVSVDSGRSSEAKPGAGPESRNQGDASSIEPYR